MPDIWFIRHAESEANAGLPTDDPATIRLTHRGFEQAEEIAQSFQRAPDLIITSPYLRTQQTARPTLRRFPSASSAQWNVQEFTYLAPEGKTTCQERRPRVEEFWERCDPVSNDGEGTESFIQFITRVLSVLHELRSAKQEFIAVFSHEQFISAALWLLLNDKLDEDPRRCGDCMQRFRHLLLSSPIPNGAILPVQLWRDRDPLISAMIHSHLAVLCQRPDIRGTAARFLLSDVEAEVRNIAILNDVVLPL
jgi:2,3-bisphosphoglycerate-dependent phosphoglycerate mutase